MIPAQSPERAELAAQMLLALLLVVYVGAIGVAVGVLLVAIEVLSRTVGWPGCSSFSS
jgi:hypothetical protein